MIKLMLIFMLLFTFGCDNKDKVKYVTQSAYDELREKYETLELKNRLLKHKNEKLNNENEILKHDLDNYKDGFKSMYE